MNNVDTSWLQVGWLGTSVWLLSAVLHSSDELGELLYWVAISIVVVFIIIIIIIITNQLCKGRPCNMLLVICDRVNLHCCAGDLVCHMWLQHLAQLVQRLVSIVLLRLVHTLSWLSACVVFKHGDSCFSGFEVSVGLSLIFWFQVAMKTM